MKTIIAKTKPKAAAGRPRSDDPKANVTLRFDPQVIAEIDAWAKDHGDMPRSAAIRLAVSNLLKGRTTEKSS